MKCPQVQKKGADKPVGRKTLPSPPVVQACRPRRRPTMCSCLNRHRQPFAASRVRPSHVLGRSRRVLTPNYLNCITKSRRVNLEKVFLYGGQGIKVLDCMITGRHHHSSWLRPGGTSPSLHPRVFRYSPAPGNSQATENCESPTKPTFRCPGQFV